MCFAAALPIASFAMSAASSVATYGAQKAHAAEVNATYQQNYVQALASDRDTQNALTLREMQDQGATEQQLQASFLDEAKRSAQAEVSGVASGNTGISLDSLVQEVGRVGEQNRATLTSNFQGQVQQLQAQKQGANTKEQMIVNDLPTASSPSFFGPLAGIAGAGFKSFATQKSIDTQAGV
jgi:hypothetical protein